jgi:putative ABC transport system substrate-binding protein
MGNRVGVVVSDDLEVYRAPTEAFLQQFPEQPRVYHLHGRAQDAAVVTKELSAWNPHVVVCVGAKAAYAVKAAMPSTPVVYVAVRDPARYGIAGAQVTGVSMAVDPLTFVSQFTGFFPEVETIGVIRGPQTSDERSAALVAAGDELGKSIVVESVEGPRDVRRALATLVDRGIGALWVPPDRAVLTTGTYRMLSEEARRRHLPLLVDTTSMVEAGGTFTMVPDPEGIARQAIGMVDQILAGAAPAVIPPASPDELLVVLNLRTMATAGLEVDELLLDFVDLRIE